MPMRFTRAWDFNPGNKQLDLNSLTQDQEVIVALQEALGLAAGGAIASQTTYDNTASGLAADDVQAALDEIVAELPTDTDTDDQTAAQVPYDNVASDLAGGTVQEAVDELAARTGVVLLEAGQTAANVPAGTPVKTIVLVKA